MLAAGTNHAVGILSDGQLAVWGESGKFVARKETEVKKKQKPEASSGNKSTFSKVQLKWKGCDYKARSVAIGANMTVVVGYCDEAERDQSNEEEIAKILAEIKARYLNSSAKSLYDFFQDENNKIGTFADADELKKEEKKSRDLLSQEEQFNLDVFGTVAPEKVTPMEEIKKGLKMDEDKSKKAIEILQQKAQPVEKADLSKLLTEPDVLESCVKEDEKDDQPCAIEIVKKVLDKWFSKRAREIDMFINEMKRKSHNKSQTEFSLRVIKDGIFNSRADSGRVFVYSAKENHCKLFLSESLESDSILPLMYVPRSVMKGSEPIAEVACGSFHIMMLSQTGELFTCGDNSQGALGLSSSKAPVTIPMRVIIKKFMGERKISRIAAGSEHSMCLTVQNELFTWGNGLNGRLGHQNELNQCMPVEVRSLVHHIPYLIAAGEAHSALVTSNGKLMTWGDSIHGQLGFGKDVRKLTEPQVVSDIEGDISFVACGQYHTIAIDTHGRIHAFGQNSHKQIGNNETKADFKIHSYDVSPRIIAACAGSRNSYLISSSPSAVYALGGPENNMLCRQPPGSEEEEEEGKERLDSRRKLLQKENLAQAFQPGQVTNLSSFIISGLTLGEYFTWQKQPEFNYESTVSTGIKKIACGPSNTFVITNAGELYCTGTNAYGQLGCDPRSLPWRKNPELVSFGQQLTPQEIITMVSCGFDQVLAVTNKMRLFSWGSNDKGQLGRLISEEVPGVSKKKAGLKENKVDYDPGLVDVGQGNEIRYCACGYLCSACITITGEVYTWGCQDKGRLGIGLVDEKGIKENPTKVVTENFPRIAEISIGDNHVLAIPDYDSEDPAKPKGIWSWGIGNNGILGHGNEENLFAPKLIQRVKDKMFKKVCCGDRHSLALSRSGELLFWGAKEHCLGAEDVEEDNRMEPVLIKIIDICVCKNYNLGLGKNNEGFFWGNFADAANDDQEYKKSKKVIECKVGVPAEKIACGANHGIALGKDRNLYAWGNSSEGALGYSYDGKALQPPGKMVASYNAIFEGNKSTMTEAQRQKLQARSNEQAGGADQYKKKGAELRRDENKAGEDDEGEQKRAATIPDLDRNERFQKLQEKLRDHEELKIESLSKKKKLLSEELDRMMAKFATVKEKRDRAKADRKKLEIGLIGRLECGPFAQKKHFHLINAPPLYVRKYKKNIKTILLALYLHPCYMIKLLEQRELKEIRKDLLKSIYRTSVSKQFTATLVCHTALQLFKKEYQVPTEKSSTKFVEREGFNLIDSSLFALLFDMLFEAHPENITFSANCAALLFNALYRIVQQKETTAKGKKESFDELYNKETQETKNIEERLKAKCEICKDAMTDWKQKMKERSGETETASNIFNTRGSGSGRLSPHIVLLLSECKNAMVQELLKSRSSQRGKGSFEGNADDECCKVLFPLLMRRTCLMLHKTELLIVYSEHNKAKSEILRDEVKRLDIGCKVFAHILYSYAARVDAFPWKATFQAIQEFNKQLHYDAKDIFDKCIAKPMSDYFIKTFIDNACIIDKTPVCIRLNSLKALLKFLSHKQDSIYLMQPREKDPLYQSISCMDIRFVSDDKEKRLTKLSFNINPGMGPDDTMLFQCKDCRCYMSNNYSTQSCEHFINDDIPKQDYQDLAFLNEQFLFPKECDVSHSEDTRTNPVEQNLDQAKKIHSFKLQEICYMMMELIKEEKKKRADAKGTFEIYQDIHKKTIDRFNTKKRVYLSIEEKSKLLKKLQDIIDSKIRKMDATHDRSDEIARNISFGIANSEELDPLAKANRRLTLIRQTRNVENSQVISKELFEYLERGEKQKLVPFYKNTLKALFKSGVLRRCDIEHIGEISKNCMLALSFDPQKCVIIRLLFVDFKDPCFGLCGRSRQEVETVLFTAEISQDRLLDAYKNAHKYLTGDIDFFVEWKKRKILEFNTEKLVKLIYDVQTQKDIYYRMDTRDKKDKDGDDKY